MVEGDKLGRVEREHTVWCLNSLPGEEVSMSAGRVKQELTMLMVWNGMKRLWIY